MQRRFYVIDAFTDEPYAGNPAAVVLDADGLDDKQMQAIAAEFNLSETAFVLPSTDSSAAFRLRWFTPSVEVNLCGHATIAAVRALVDADELDDSDTSDDGSIGIETRSGILGVWVERMPGETGSLLFWLRLPPPSFAAVTFDRSELCNALALDADALAGDLPIVRTTDDDAIVFVQDFATLQACSPDFAKLLVFQEAHGLRGTSVATVNTLSPAIHVQSRFFAPATGINEDPVTGSVHGPLAAILASRGIVPFQDGVAALTCVQSKAGGRAGLLYALVHQEGDDVPTVRIGGHATITMRGSLVN